MPQKITKFYQNIAILFVLTSLILTGGIFYFNLAKAVVVITPSAEKSNIEFIVDIKEFPFEPKDLGKNEIDGKIFELVKEGSKTFSSTGTKRVESDSVGKVTIINNYSKDQTLIATTRLLSPDGVLLRTKNDIVVPAGQKLSVEVYPDRPEEFTELEPTTFVIPGLWQGLQDKIYGESYQKLAKGGFAVKIVSLNDLDSAMENLKGELYQQALKEVDDQLSITEKLHTKVVKLEVIESNTEAEAGQEIEEFDYNLKLKIVVVVFDEKKLLNLVGRRIKQELPPNKQLFALDASSLSYNLEKYDLEEKVANLKVEALALSTLTKESELFSKEDLIDMSEQEVKDYFAQFGEIKSIEIKFIPSWLKKMPGSAERIEIEIK